MTPYIIYVTGITLWFDPLKVLRLVYLYQFSYINYLVRVFYLRKFVQT